MISRTDSAKLVANCAMGRLLPGFIATLAVMGLLLFSAPAHAQVSKEYQLKAAILIKFLGFIDWPADSEDSALRDRSICIIGDNPFGDSVERLIASPAAGNFRISISYLRELRDAHCHLAFISRSERARAASLIGTARSRGIVSVSDMAGFAGMGGNIELTTEGPYVRFIINNVGVDEAPYRFSAQLLALARNLVGRASYDNS